MLATHLSEQARAGEEGFVGGQRDDGRGPGSGRAEGPMSVQAWAQAQHRGGWRGDDRACNDNIVLRDAKGGNGRLGGRLLRIDGMARGCNCVTGRSIEGAPTTAFAVRGPSHMSNSPERP